MSGRSKAETRALGEEIARLRTHRNWPRVKLLKELDKAIDAIGYEGKMLSEAWLHRLETGQVVILPRLIFNAICDALQCNDEERARLHFLGDRNVVVVIPGVTTKLAEIFNYLMLDLYNDVCAIVASQAGNQPITKLTQADIHALFYTAIEIVIADRRSRNQGDG